MFDRQISKDKKRKKWEMLLLPRRVILKTKVSLHSYVVYIYIYTIICSYCLSLHCKFARLICTWWSKESRIKFFKGSDSTLRKLQICFGKWLFLMVCIYLLLTFRHIHSLSFRIKRFLCYYSPKLFTFELFLRSDSPIFLHLLELWYIC